MFQKLNLWERRLGMRRIAIFTVLFAMLATLLVSLVESKDLDRFASTHATIVARGFYLLVWLACVGGVVAFVFRGGKVWLLLALALVFGTSRMQAGEFRLLSEEQQSSQKPEAIGIVICGICVLVIGGVVVYELCKIKIPPVNAPETNDVPPVVPPPFTNNMPTDNPATNKPPHHWWKPHASVMAYSNNVLAADVQYFSLPGTVLDTNGAFPAPFTAYLTMPLMSVQASKDLTNWQGQSLEIWASAAGMVEVLHGFHGEPVSTNYQALQDGEPVLPPVMPDFGIWSGDEPVEFYRSQ